MGYINVREEAMRIINDCTVKPVLCTATAEEYDG